jgi:hypothetical protein
MIITNKYKKQINKIITTINNKNSYNYYNNKYKKQI